MSGDEVEDTNEEPQADATADAYVDPATTDEATAPEGTDATGSAVPPPTDLTTTTTTAPPAPIEQLAIGDSVMLGAAPELSDNGFIVDAAESRQFSNGADTVATLNTQGRLGSVVVVHLGTNGTINDGDMTRMMEALAGVPQVLMLTLDVDRDWIPGNNALIYDTVNSYANVSLLDWAGLAGSCPGDCFASDGFHLRPDGQVYYAALIEGALQAPS